MESIFKWVRRQSNDLSEAYLVFEPDGLMLYVLSRRQDYDFELSQQLSEFSVQLADQGINVNTTLLPATSPEELLTFFDPRQGPAIHIPAE